MRQGSGHSSAGMMPAEDREGDRRGVAPLPTRGIIPLDPYLRMLLDAASRLVSRSCLKKRERPACRRVLPGTAAKSRRTGAQSAPGKGTGESLGKASFPPGIIPSLFLCPEASNFSQLRVTGGGCLFFPTSNFANYGSRVLSTLVGSGAKPRRSPCCALRS